MLTLVITFALLSMRVTSDLVSRGKPTTISSSWNSLWKGPLVVDGVYETTVSKGSCFHSQDDGSPFLIIDLLGSFTIDHVVLYNRVDCCSEKIVGSVIELLSQTNQVIYECGNITQSFAVYDIPCGNNVAQKVRVRGAKKQILHFCELEVHGDQVMSLISQDKPTYQSSFYGDMDGSLAVDGRYDNYVNKDDVYDLRNCFVSEQEEMPFFIVDLKGTFTIDRVTLFNREDCCSERMVGAVVQLLYTNGELIYECGNITETMNVYNVSCGNNFAQKIRIVGAPDEYLQLCELEVYGKSQSLPIIISRKKPTTQSGMYASLNSSLAVDGLYNNYIDRQGVLNWPTCFHSMNDKVPFMEVDLQGKFRVNYIALYNRMDGSSQRIMGAIVELISKTGTVLYQCGKITDIRATYTISCGNRIAYKVRVTAKANEFLQICELDVFGASAYTIISRGKTTSFSSAFGGLGGSFAVDGIYEYNFNDQNDINLFHTKDDKEPFWEVNLQANFIIDKVVIYNRMDCCSERLIGATVELVTETGGANYECGKITETKSIHSIQCGLNVAYKVRIKGALNEFLHFTEVDVYGDYPD